MATPGEAAAAAGQPLPAAPRSAGSGGGSGAVPAVPAPPAARAAPASAAPAGAARSAGYRAAGPGPAAERRRATGWERPGAGPGPAPPPPPPGRGRAGPAGNPAPGSARRAVCAAQPVRNGAERDGTRRDGRDGIGKDWTGCVRRVAQPRGTALPVGQPRRRGTSVFNSPSFSFFFFEGDEQQVYANHPLGSGSGRRRRGAILNSLQSLRWKSWSSTARCPGTGRWALGRERPGGEGGGGGPSRRLMDEGGRAARRVDGLCGSPLPGIAAR